MWKAESFGDWSKSKIKSKSKNKRSRQSASVSRRCNFDAFALFWAGQGGACKKPRTGCPVRGVNASTVPVGAYFLRRRRTAAPPRPRAAASMARPVRPAAGTRSVTSSLPSISVYTGPYTVVTESVTRHT